MNSGESTTIKIITSKQMITKIRSTYSNYNVRPIYI